MVWMMEEAAWKDREIFYEGKTILLRRGQFCRSLRGLAEAWKWEKTKVVRFLKAATDLKIIAPDSTPGILVVTICNYGVFQDQENLTAPPVDEKPHHERTTTAPFLKKVEEREEDNNQESNTGKIVNLFGEGELPGVSKYAFDGAVIKLKARDFNLWESSAPHVALRPWLLDRDAFLAEQPIDKQKGWFFSTQKELGKTEMRAVAPSPASQTGGGRVYADDAIF